MRGNERERKRKIEREGGGREGGRERAGGKERQIGQGERRFITNVSLCM